MCQNASRKVHCTIYIHSVETKRSIFIALSKIETVFHGSNELLCVVMQFAVFIKQDEKGSLFLTLAYMDGLSIILACKQRLDTEVFQFLSTFDGTGEPLNYYLGVQVLVCKRRLDLSQTALINEILLCYWLSHCQTYVLPMTLIFFE